MKPTRCADIDDGAKTLAALAAAVQEDRGGDGIDIRVRKPPFGHWTATLRLTDGRTWDGKGDTVEAAVNDVLASAARRTR